MNDKDILLKRIGATIRQSNENKIEYQLSQLLADLGELAPPLRKKSVTIVYPGKKVSDFEVKVVRSLQTD